MKCRSKGVKRQKTWKPVFRDLQPIWVPWWKNREKLPFLKNLRRFLKRSARNLHRGGVTRAFWGVTGPYFGGSRGAEPPWWGVWGAKPPSENPRRMRWPPTAVFVNLDRFSISHKSTKIHESLRKSTNIYENLWKPIKIYETHKIIVSQFIPLSL